MDFQKIFGTAFRYPLNMKIFTVFFVFNLFMTVPPILYAPSSQIQTMQEIVNMFMFLVPFWIISFFIGSFVAAFFYDSASNYYHKTKYGKFSESLGTAKKRYVPLLGTQILFFLIVAIVFAAFAAGPLMLTLAGFSFGVLLFTGLLLGLSAAVVLAFFLFLCPLACVLGGFGPFESLKKSYSLVRVNKAGVLAFGLILFLVVFIIGIAGSIPSSTYTVSGGETLSATGFVLILFQVLFSSYVGLFVYSASVNLYTSLSEGAKVMEKARTKPSTKKPAEKRKAKKAKGKARKKGKK